jgi:nucleotide-binding universal stress UspA family protein
MYQRILVPTDGSPLSRKAVKAAIDLALATGAELVAFNVVPRYPSAQMEDGISVARDERARIEKDWSARGLAKAESARDSAIAAGVKAKAASARSDQIAETLLAAARKHKCDLIVMASHGRRGLKRLLLGSETQNVLTHSDIPVLVLR